MTHSFSKHDWIALAAITAWAAAIVVTIVNPDMRSRALVPVLVCSVTTLAGAVLLSLYWSKRATVHSFGTLFLVPFACAFLFVIMFGTPLVEACSSGHLFDASYWNLKGGVRLLLLEFGVLWGVCVFPAAAVTLYFQRQHETDRPNVV